jgi:uncharacterized damage-inducible protein DinB
MTDLGLVWEFTRMRLDAALDGVTEVQAAWRPYPGAHCIAEHLVHVAGAEHYWAARLRGLDPRGSEFESKLDRSVREGYLVDGLPPFGADGTSLSFGRRCLDHSRAEIGDLMSAPSADQLAREVESPVGDQVTGKQGLVRLAQHAGYHTGQIWLIRMHPEFPSA